MLLFRPSESAKSIDLLHDGDLSWFKKKEKAFILTSTITEDRGRGCVGVGGHAGLEVVQTLGNNGESRRNLGISKNLWSSRMHYKHQAGPYQKESGRQTIQVSQPPGPSLCPTPMLLTMG